MNIDFSKPILNLKDQPIMSAPDEELTMRAVATDALLAAHDEDENIPGDEKARRFALALSIHKANAPLDMKVEDLALLKKLIARRFMPLVVGRAYEFLN